MMRHQTLIGTSQSRKVEAHPPAKAFDNNPKFGFPNFDGNASKKVQQKKGACILPF